MRERGREKKRDSVCGIIIIIITIALIRDSQIVLGVFTNNKNE